MNASLSVQERENAMAAAAAARESGGKQMGVDAEKLGRKFPAFPYKPYSIQIDFMRALYESLDKGGVAMLESPTGTGKTLSIICSALQWLVDQKKKQICSSKKECFPDDEPDWMRNFSVTTENHPESHKKLINKSGVQSYKFNNIVKSERSCRDLFGGRSADKVTSRTDKNANAKAKRSLEVDDEEYLMEDYNSENEEGTGEKSKRKAIGVSLGSSSDDDDDDEQNGGDAEKEGLKVYFCSRTHSQLSQFINELRKTLFGSELKVVSLGSRKNLCINEDVLRLGNPMRINERCLELQKSKKSEISKVKNLGAGGRVRRTKASGGCPMLSKKKLQKEFRSEVSQQEALDIEDLVDVGRQIGTCPYYGSRSMVHGADLVVLPYQSLLSKSSRESLGLNLKNNIVIIDEAHNLADCLISMYDVKITLSQLQTVHRSLERYLERFRNLLGSGNRRYIQTLLVLTQAFKQVILEDNERIQNSNCADIAHAGETKARSGSLLTINDFLFSLNIDNINFVKLIHYVKESNIIHKVSGYGDKVACLHTDDPHEGKLTEEESTLSGFQALMDMFLSLMNNNTDGRMIISRTESTNSMEQVGFIKYVMLTGEHFFAEIMNQAHAVVLAGGTLQPIEETKDRLFPSLSPEKFSFFSCTHIVPAESILPIAVSCGPSGLSLDFSYSSRSLPKMMGELGLLLCNLVTVVPGGIVVFFSSFDYEKQVYDAWMASGVLQRILRRKLIFREPRSSAEVEAVMKEYKETIDRSSNKQSKDGEISQNGAVMLAVVGGKISEGINFSDGMGRCIVMVGLPYPSPNDVELIERIKHMEGPDDKPSISLSCKYEIGDVQAGFDTLRRCKRKGKEYYENLCMKAVNQSIGRAIRHINDYAAILLVDSRYASDPLKRSSSHPTNKLPQWIRDSLVSETANYGEVHRLLSQFFRYNKQKNTRHQTLL